MDLSFFRERMEQYRVLNLIISQHGEVIGELDTDDRARRNIYSASKSFTSAAVGIAQREGLLSIEERLVDAFPDDLPETVSDHLQKATVRDLLTMALGQEKAFLMGGERPYIKEDDWVKLSLSIPLVYEPGTHFVYNNVGPYLAGVLVQRRAGCDLVSYLMPRLFGPLGIRRPTWEADPMGYTFGAGGLFLNVEELHKLGLLYLQDGCWNGKQLVPAEWVRESTRRQVENGTPYGYGYLFWGSPCGAFRADGKYCQLSFILRDKYAVITTVSECRDSEGLIADIFEELYPRL